MTDALIVVSGPEARRAVRYLLGRIVDGQIARVTPDPRGSDRIVVQGTPGAIIRLSYHLTDCDIR